MGWVKSLSNIVTKAAKYAAFVIILVETLQFFGDKLTALTPPEKDEIKEAEND